MSVSSVVSDPGTWPDQYQLASIAVLSRVWLGLSTPEAVFDLAVWCAGRTVPTWNVTLPTADRPWVVGIGELLPGGSAPAWSIPLAVAAAIPVTLFLFIEQTITGLLLQQPAANLAKGSCDLFHFGFVVKYSLSLLKLLCTQHVLI